MYALAFQLVERDEPVHLVAEQAISLSDDQRVALHQREVHLHSVLALREDRLARLCLIVEEPCPLHPLGLEHPSVVLSASSLLHALRHALLVRTVSPVTVCLAHAFASFFA